MYNLCYVVQTAYFLIMEIIMKKLIAAAVATSVSAIAVADVSITGNAKYEYFNSQTGTNASTNKSNTEVNLSIKGKKGDTGVVMNLEFNTHGDVSTGTHTVSATTSTSSTTAESTEILSTTTVTHSQRAAGTLDVEDMYLTTKVGDINVKAGNFASGTSALLGEIDNGGRATNKVDLSTTIGGMKVYAGNTGRGDTGEAATGSTALDNNMYAGVVLDVAGNTVQFKKNSPTVDSYGIAGSFGGVSYRYEHKDNDAATSDVTFGEVKGEVSGVTLGYAWVDADAVNLVTEDDSAIFAVEMASSGTGDGKSTGNKQIMAATTVDGNKITFKSGSLENGISTGVDKDYQQISVSRALASGANAVVTYTSKDNDATTDTDTLEVELNVSF
jgi:hypothetical protein